MLPLAACTEGCLAAACCLCCCLAISIVTVRSLRSSFRCFLAYGQREGPVVLEEEGVEDEAAEVEDDRHHAEKGMLFTRSFDNDTSSGRDSIDCRQ